MTGDAVVRGGSRRWIQGVAILLVAVVVILGVTEGVLRWLEIPFHATWTPSENAMAEFDPELGWVYKPASSFVVPFGSERRLVPIHFDPLGARVAGPEGSRDPDLPTVFFVGGSYTMGHGLPYEETFVGRLDADPSFPFQVINLGVQGYGTDQSLLRLERYLDRFHTVAVVYTFIEDHILRNDVSDRRLIIPYARFLGTKPRFALDADGDLELVDRPRRYDEMFQLQLWNWIRLFWFQNGPAPRSEVTRALVGRMRDEVEARGASFLVVNWVQDIQYPETTGPTIPWAGPPPLDLPRLDVLDTGIDAPPGWDSWVIPGDFHPDAGAHARVAGLVRERFARLGIVSGSAPEAAPRP